MKPHSQSSSAKARSAAERNPFRVPTDTEIFALHNSERERRIQERRSLKDKPLHQRHTNSTRLVTRKIADDEPEEKPTEPAGPVECTAIRKEKESIADFLQKKRDMFKIQMLLETKKDEIKNLEQVARKRENDIAHRETELEEDRSRFEDFLKDNDNKAVEAAKLQELETKLKNDKLQEIKKVQGNLEAIKKEIARYEEELADCKKFKEFLDKLTPPEWLADQQRLAKEKRDELLAAKKARIMAEMATNQDGRSTATPPPGSGGGDGAHPGPTPPLGRRMSITSSQKSLPTMRSMRSQAKIIVPEPDIAVTLDEEEEFQIEEAMQKQMYFVHPQQLLDVLKELEDGNLFLIQNSQETEQALDDLKQNFQETKQRMENEAAALKEQLKTLQEEIALEEQKAAGLRENAQKTTGFEQQEEFLDKIKERVARVYVKCNFDNDAKMDTLSMLANIEAKMEQYLKDYDDIMHHLSPEDVQEAENIMKQKERERREKQMKKKMRQQQERDRERMQRALQLSLAPVVKKTGKPVMGRSAKPAIRRKTKEVKPEDSAQEHSFYT